MSTSKSNFWLSTNGLAAIGLIAAAPDEPSTQPVFRLLKLPIELSF